MEYILIDSCPTEVTTTTKRTKTTTKQGWNSQNFCILKRNCITTTETRVSRKRIRKITKQVECPCPISHKYKCNHIGFCTKDRLTCNELQRMSKDSTKKLNAKYCLASKKFWPQIDSVRNTINKTNI